MVGGGEGVADLHGPGREAKPLHLLLQGGTDGQRQGVTASSRAWTGSVGWLSPWVGITKTPAPP